MDSAKYRLADERLWSSAEVTPQELFVRLPRLGSDVRVQIVGDGPPVLFVHGAPNAGSAWAPLMGALSSYRCFLLDRPGTGLSAPLSGKWSTERMLTYADSLVADALDALDLEHADVVASSFGGYITLRSAAAHPDRIDRIVQMGAPALVPGMTVPRFMRLLTAPVIGNIVRRLPPTASGNNSVMREMGHHTSLDSGRFPDAFLDWYLALQRHTDTMRHDGAMIAASARRGRFADELLLTDETLHKVVAPTLLFWGADDGFGGADVGTDLATRLPHATLDMLEGGGHLPWLDNPSRAAAAVASWLSADATV